MSIEITCTAPGTSPNYVKYLYGSITKVDRVNDSDYLDFSLVPTDSGFVKLRRGNYIRVISAEYGVWFTGYITNDPEIEWLGNNGSDQAWGYKYQATSDDYILSMKPLGLWRDFINTTQGQILRTLIENLAPGMFDTENIQDGQRIARYRVDPASKFVDVISEFAASADYSWTVSDHSINFAPVSDNDCGFSIDGNSKDFHPIDLTLTPSKDAIVNDVLVVGDDEPQDFVFEYFVGDDFTAQYAMVASPYGCNQNVMLDETFENNAIDTSKWVEWDYAQDFIKVSNGFLNVVGGNANNTLSVNLSSVQLFPFEGAFKITHGEFDFLPLGPTNGLCGVVGGLWSSLPNYTPTNGTFPGCYHGFRVFRDGSGAIKLREIVNGAVTSNEVPVDTSKRYLIRTLYSPIAYMNNFTQSYTYRGEDGAVNDVIAVDDNSDLRDRSAWQANTYISEVDINNGTVSRSFSFVSPMTNLLDQVYGSPSEYFVYSPVASNNLHCTVKGITISQPYQANLYKSAKGTLNFTPLTIGPNEMDVVDGLSPVATIVESGNSSAVKNSSGNRSGNPTNATLTFFKDSSNLTDTIPKAGEIVLLRYRRSGASMARVVDTSLTNAEKGSWGDTGVRSKLITSLNPTPRNSAECEAAAKAFILGNNYSHYEGSYVIWSDFCEGQPKAGTILRFSNLNPKLPQLQAELVTEVKTTIECDNPERFRHEVSFGNLDRIRRLLAKFAKATNNVASTSTTSNLDASMIDVKSVGFTFPPDMVNVALTGYDSDNTHFNINQEMLPEGGVEVRYSDDSWGVDDGLNLVTRLMTADGETSFSVPRTSRGRVFYIKNFDSRNKVLYSEDLSNPAWSKVNVIGVGQVSEQDPDGNTSSISKVVTGNLNGQYIEQYVELPVAGKTMSFTIDAKVPEGVSYKLWLYNSTLTDGIQSQDFIGNGLWQRNSVTYSFPSNVSGDTMVFVRLDNAKNNIVYLTRASLEVGTNVETAYCKTIDYPYGALSRFPTCIHVEFPGIPPSPSANFNANDLKNPVIEFVLPEIMLDVYGVRIRNGDGDIVYDRPLSAADFVPSYTLANNSAREFAYSLSTYNVLNEDCTDPYHINFSVPVPAIGTKPGGGTTLTVSDTVKVLYWLPINYPKAYRVIISPNADMSNPSLQDVVGEEPVYVISDEEFFPQRYIQVIPVDELGDGTPSEIISHKYVPIGVLSFDNTQNITSIPATTPSATIPPAWNNPSGSFYDYRYKMQDEIYNERAKRWAALQPF